MVFLLVFPHGPKHCQDFALGIEPSEGSVPRQRGQSRNVVIKHDLVENQRGQSRNVVIKHDLVENKGCTGTSRYLIGMQKKH